MPGRITELTETQIIRDILTDLRRHRTNAAAQEPIWTHDIFTAPATYQLTYLPYGINALADNGVMLSEGTDYTVNYTTGLVTFTVARTAGHVIFVSYVTNGDLVALSGPVDYGAVGNSAGFQIVSNAAQLGSSPPTLGANDHYAAWVETSRTLNDVTAVIRNIPGGNVTVCCSVSNVNVGRVAWVGASADASRTLGYTVSSSTGASASGGVSGFASFPVTVRCVVNSSGLLTIYLNGTSVGTFDVATNVPSAWTDVQAATKVGFLQNTAGNPLESFQTTDAVWSDSFNRADQQGLAAMDTGQVWNYNP